jgi:hypothetical protein
MMVHFRVRRDKVRTALQWLKPNHKWYRHIQISEQRLSQLPEDDNLEDNFVTQHEDSPLPPDSVIEDDVEPVNDVTDAMGMIFN